MHPQIRSLHLPKDLLDIHQLTLQLGYEIPLERLQRKRPLNTPSEFIL